MGVEFDREGKLIMDAEPDEDPGDAALYKHKKRYRLVVKRWKWAFKSERTWYATTAFFTEAEWKSYSDRYYAGTPAKKLLYTEMEFAE